MNSLDERDASLIPTIYAKCTKCDRRYLGAKVGDYYGSSFTEKQWARGPVCENCKGELSVIRRVRYE